MGFDGHQFGHPLEDREIALFLGGQKTEPLEERDDVFPDGVEVIDLVHPDAVALEAKRAALEMSLQECQNDFVFLGHIQTQRNLPRHVVVASSAEGQMKAAFSVDETGKVISDGIRDLVGAEHERWPFLLIACTARIVTACLFLARMTREDRDQASTVGYSGVPANSRILQLRV